MCADRRRRRKRTQPGNHLGTADVAGMDDMVDARQPRAGLGAQQTMRLRMIQIIMAEAS